ncbi:MAG: TRAP transporter small permease [Pseudomonadota bacterium]
MNVLLSWLENLALWVAGAALMVMGAIVTASVVGRVAFNAPVPDDLIMVGLLMVCVIILPLAFIERTNGHIAVTVVADLLPERVQAALKALGNILFGIFFGVMGVMLARKVPSEFADELYYDGQLEVPTWPMKAVFAIGVAIFVTRLAVRFVGHCRIVIWGPSPPEAKART